MTTSTPDKIRLTITVSSEVHQTFQRFAKAASMPVGRAMGEWLGDTLDAANFTAQKMEEARAAPALVARELHSYALGITDETTSLMQKMREEGTARRAAGHAKRATQGGGTAPTPPSNTGVTNKNTKPSRGTR